jgi:hypothetical protein
MSRYLYGLSVNGIQSYIFKTNELKTIVGASEIIKNISKTIETNYAKNIMVNAAGNIKLIFGESEKDILENLVLNFPKEIKQCAFGIELSQAVVKFEEGELKEKLKKLESNLAAQRNKNEIPLDISINILDIAPKTANPTVRKINDEEQDKATVQKEKANTSKGEIPKNRKNKTAIIHADGNGLGAMIASMTKDLKTDDEIIDEYKTFSIQLDRATTKAFEVARKDIDDKDIRDVILGGDDMTIICNANYALEFTNKFLSEFEKQTKEEFNDDSLSACAGIAYCNHKFPFHYAVNLAESLCKYSKNISRTKSSLMFHNIQSSYFQSFDEYIDKELILENDKESIHLNYGPYFLYPHKKHSTIEHFLNLSGALKVKGSPFSRLREWLTILGQNSDEAKERLERIVSMMDLKEDIYKKDVLEKNLKQFNEEIELNELKYTRDDKTFTPIGDLNTYLSVVDWS